MGERGFDEEACWRWAFRKAYRRNPRAGELDRYKFWHRVSRRDGFDASGPWETWPHRPIPPDEERVDAPLEPSPPLVLPPPALAPAVARLPGNGEKVATSNDRTSWRREVSKAAAETRPPRDPISIRAQALVRAQLENGPKHGELVKAAAVAAKISERELLSATDKLGVRPQRGQWWLPV